MAFKINRTTGGGRASKQIREGASNREHREEISPRVRAEDYYNSY